MIAQCLATRNTQPGGALTRCAGLTFAAFSMFAAGLAAAQPRGGGVPPTVVSIARVAASPTAAASVGYAVTFSEDVSGVDAGDFTLTVVDGAISVLGVTNVAGGPSVYTVTAGVGAADGELRLDLLDDNSIASTGSALALGGIEVGDGDFTSGETYLIDRNAPTATITMLDPSPTHLDQVRYQIEFDEPVAPTFAEADITLVGQALTGSATFTLTGTDPVYVVTIIPVNGQRHGEGGIVIGTQIFDALGNQFAGATPTPYILDNKQPRVNSITTLDPNPTNLDAVHWSIRFSEDMDPATVGLDAFRATGTLGNTTVFSLSGGANPTLDVTATPNDPNANGTIGFILSRSAADFADNHIRRDIASPLYTIDNIPPTAVITSDHPPITSADVLGYTIVFSEVVAPTFALDDITLMGTLSADAVTTLTATVPRTYFYQVAPADPNADGTISFTIGTAVFDLAGNQFAGAASPLSTIDHDALLATITLTDPNPTIAASVSFAISWNFDVLNTFTEDDITLIGSLAGASTFELSGTSPDFSLVATPDDPGASGTLGFAIGTDVTDADARPFAGTSSALYEIDHIAPSSMATAPSGVFTNLSEDIPVEYVADDGNGGGVDFVELWVRLGTSGDFEQYPGNFTESPIHFDSLPFGGPGTYQFYTIAVDVLGFREEAPAEPDITVEFDFLRDEPTTNAFSAF